MPRTPALLAMATAVLMGCMPADAEPPPIPEREIARFEGVGAWNSPQFEVRDGRKLRVAVTRGRQDGEPLRIWLYGPADQGPGPPAEILDVMPGSYGWAYNLEPGPYYLSIGHSDPYQVIIFEGGS